jgi:hypothetical protein
MVIVSTIRRVDTKLLEKEDSDDDASIEIFIDEEERLELEEGFITKTN